MHSGWVMYDAAGEYARMGIPNQHWVVSSVNELYQVGMAHCLGAGLHCVATAAVV